MNLNTLTVTMGTRLAARLMILRSQYQAGDPATDGMVASNAQPPITAVAYADAIEREMAAEAIPTRRTLDGMA